MKRILSSITLLGITGMLITGCQPKTTQPAQVVSSPTQPATVEVLPTTTPAPTLDIPEPATSVPPSLEGQAWQLTSYIDAGGAQKKPLDNTQITATFANGSLTGNASCNSYFAAYQLNGDKLTIGKIGSTLMACLAPGVMVQETAYLGALQKAASFQIKAGQLEIADAQGKTILVYTAQQPLELVGNPWQLTMYASGVEALASILAGNADRRPVRRGWKIDRDSRLQYV
jgi:heat shock protein HslJ